MKHTFIFAVPDDMPARDVSILLAEALEMAVEDYTYRVKHACSDEDEKDFGRRAAEFASIKMLHHTSEEA